MSALPLSASREIDRGARRALGQSAAHVALKLELLHALVEDPASTVHTPAFKPQHMEARLVFLDHLEGHPEALDALISIVVDAAALGQRCEGRATIWLNDLSEAHAKYHAEDAAAEERP